MRKIINILILLVIALQCNAYNMHSTSSYIDQNRYNYSYTTPINSTVNYNSNYGYGSGARIGYTTGAYSRPTRYDSYNAAYSSSSSSGTGRPIRKTTVYDGQGNSKETPGGDNDPDGIYKYDEVTGIWYYSPDEGVTWYEWRKKNLGDGVWSMIIGIFIGSNGNTWRTVNNPPGEYSSKWATDPNDPFLDPIGEPYILLVMTLGYFIYKRKDLIEKN